MATKVKVGVLGATGAVGQRFLQQLEGHKQFEVHALGASDRSSGKTYKAAARWLLSSPLPPCFSDMIMWPCDVTTKDTPFKECKIVFSALDSSVAGDIELSFASHGVAVFSNAKNHRYEKDVPILVPSVNPDHLNMIKYQQEVRGWDSGFIVTNPNCSTSGLVVALKPIDVCFGIDECVVFTMQAVSGAGYPGVASLDILDNVVPFIDGEEDKLELESRKILGQISSSTTTSLSSMAFTPQPFKISAHTNRVPVIDGHTMCVSLKLKKKATPKEVEDVLRSFSSSSSSSSSSSLPSSPSSPISVVSQRDRPQPRLDREKERGYVVTVGRVRGGSSDPSFCSFDIRLVLLVHNTVLGAAGGAIINAELAFSRGLF